MTTKERSALFNGEMVRSILAGTKTKTRRPVKVRGGLDFIGGRGEENDPGCWGYFFDGPDHHGYMVLERGLNERHDHGRISIPNPLGEPGDRLRLLSSWATDARYDGIKPTELPRPGDPTEIGLSTLWTRWMSDEKPAWCGKLRPGRFLPSTLRWVMPIAEVTGVRVERVQDISEADARAEGIVETRLGMADTLVYHTGTWPAPKASATAIDAFAALWRDIYGAESWERNDWVWVTEFRRVETQNERGAA